MTDAVTRFPGVYRRNDSAVYQFGLRAPEDLRHRFPGPWACRCSLRTSDLREANERAKALHAEWSAKFADWRRQDNPRRVPCTPALAEAIGQEVRRWVLQADDNFRTFPEGPRVLLAREERRQALDRARQLLASPEGQALADILQGPDLRALTIGAAALSTTRAPAGAPEAAPDPLAGLTDDEAGALARWNAATASDAALSMAGNRLRGVLPLAEAVARSMGLTVEWTTPEGLAGLREVLKAYRRATEEATRRDAGEAIDTPPPVPRPAQPQEWGQEGPGAPAGAEEVRRIAHALAAWEGLAVRPAKTRSVFRRHVAQFQALAGDPPLSDISKVTASRFAADLQRWAVQEGKTRETADNVLASVKALAGVAVREGWMALNPFGGLSVRAGGKQREPRQPWTADELPRLFASPIFTAYRVPEASTAMERKAGRDAAYWVPLLCLYTGARPGEVCQLWTDDLSDLQDSEGGPLLVLEVRANAERGQSIKNPSSWRALPVHSELIRLGLRDYWRAVCDARGGKPGPLFPAIPTGGANGPGGQFGQWFGGFKAGQGFDATKTLHSFRHTLETELGFADVSPTIVDAITGHEGQGIGRKQYGATIRRNAARLRPHLERLSFPGLVLPRVFKAPAWKP